MDRFEITWQAPEFEEHAKGKLWYWGSMIIAAIFLGAAVWQGNFLFVVFIVIAEILLLVWGEKPPRVFAFRLNEKGFEVIDQKFIPYAELQAFSIDENVGGTLARIILRPKSRVRPLLPINVPRERFEKIHESLAGILPQKEWEPPLSDTLEKFLRF